MRSSAILLSVALSAATLAAALPVTEDGLVARYDAQSELAARGPSSSKEKKKDDPPSYKKVKKDPVPKYDPNGAPQNEFHSTHDPAAGSGRKDGSSGGRGGGGSSHRTRELLDEYNLVARGPSSSKEKKKDDPPSYKKVKKDPVPKYDPNGAPQNEFHSTHDPAAGSGRKDGSSGGRSGGGGSSSHRTRDLILDELYEIVARGPSSSKEKKKDDPPSYKKVKKDPVPKYDPNGAPQNEFHSTHDPAAGSGRKDGSSGSGGSSSHRTRDLTLDELYDLVARGPSGSKEKKKDDPPSYKKVKKDPVPKYDPNGAPQNEFHSTHDPAAGSGRKDGSSGGRSGGGGSSSHRTRDLTLDELYELVTRGPSGSKEKKKDDPPSYKKVKKDPVPKYDPNGAPQNEFHSSHDPAAGSGRKDGSSGGRNGGGGSSSHRTREFFDEYDLE